LQSANSLLQIILFWVLIKLFFFLQEGIKVRRQAIQMEKSIFRQMNRTPCAQISPEKKCQLPAPGDLSLCFTFMGGKKIPASM